MFILCFLSFLWFVFFVPFCGWFFLWLFFCLNRRYLWLKWWSMMICFFSLFTPVEMGAEGVSKKHMICKSVSCIDRTLLNFSLFLLLFSVISVNSVAIYLKNNDLPQSAQRTPRENARNADIWILTSIKKNDKNYSTGLTILSSFWISLINNLINHVWKIFSINV